MAERTLLNPKGAGRPAVAKKNYIPHRTREKLPRQTPAHITVKLEKSVVKTLRTKEIYKAFRMSVKKARIKGLRVLHFTLQQDHIHLLVEAKSNLEISKGMQSFGVSFTKLVQNVLGIRKRIYKHRYHIHILNSIQEIKNAWHYVSGNARKNGRKLLNIDLYSGDVWYQWAETGGAVYQLERHPRFFDLLFDLAEVVAMPIFFKTKLALA